MKARELIGEAPESVEPAQQSYYEAKDAKYGGIGVVFCALAVLLWLGGIAWVVVERVLAAGGVWTWRLPF